MASQVKFTCEAFLFNEDQEELAFVLIRKEVRL